MIRLLKSSDAQSLRDLRLLSLQSDPISFISTFDHEKSFDLYYFDNRIRYAISEPIFGLYGYFGSPQAHATHSNPTAPETPNLIAYAQLSPDYLPKASHLAYLYELFVHPDHRRNQIASSLVNHLIIKAQSHPPLEQLHLRVNSHNQPAINFYKKLGFSHIATRKSAIKEDSHTYQDELLFMLPLSH